MSAAKAHEVLEKLDQKTFGFFHIKMIVVSLAKRYQPSTRSITYEYLRETNLIKDEFMTLRFRAWVSSQTPMISSVSPC
jgi:aminopeptidase-like protein